MTKLTKNPQVQGKRAIDNARTNAIISIGRQKGHSDEKIVEEVFSDMSQEDWNLLGKQIKLFSAINEFYQQLPEKVGHPNEWRAIENYAYIVQGYVDSPQAIEFYKFIESSKTLMDVLNRILQCEEMELWQYLTYVKDVDTDWFLDYLRNTPIMKFTNLRVNRNT